MEAGRPYIVKWETGDDIFEPTFNDITIDHTQRPVEQDFVSFTGNYSALGLDKENRQLLFLGDDDKLYYPSADMIIGSCRGFFQLVSLYAGDPSSAEGINNIVLNFGDEETRIDTPLSSIFNHQSEGWHTIDGRKIVGKPTAKGIYIKNGKKVVIK